VSEQDQSGQISGHALLRAVAPQVRYLTPLTLFASVQLQRFLNRKNQKNVLEDGRNDIAEYNDWRQPFYTDSLRNRWNSIAIDGLNFGLVAAIDHLSLRPRKNEMLKLFGGVVAKESGGRMQAADISFADLRKSSNPFVRIPANRLVTLMRVSMLSNMPAAIGALLPLGEEIYRNAKGMDPKGLRIMPDENLGTNTMVGTTVVRALWEAVNGESKVLKNVQGLKAEADRPIEAVKSDILEYLYNSCVDELAKEHSVGFFGRIKRFVTRPFRHPQADSKDPVIFWEPQRIGPSDKYTKGMLAYMSECLERTQKQRYDLQGKHLELGFDEIIMLMPWINKDAPKITEYVTRSVAHGGWQVMDEIRTRLGSIAASMGKGPFNAAQKEQLASLYETELRGIYTGVIGRKLAAHPSVAPMIEIVVDGKERYTANIQQIAELLGAERVKYYLLGQGGSPSATPPGSNQYYLTTHDFLQFVDKIRGRANEETDSYDTNKNPMLLMNEQERSSLFNHAIVGKDGSRPLVPGVVSDIIGVVADEAKLANSVQLPQPDKALVVTMQQPQGDVQQAVLGTELADLAVQHAQHAESAESRGQLPRK
jgi:hypothetical protein